ncbi:MAG TPA: arylesterase [Gemmatimonadaceae bacterium]|nr:arylesterase [Gemmatimonadaceae bacterium]
MRILCIALIASVAACAPDEKNTVRADGGQAAAAAGPEARRESNRRATKVLFVGTSLTAGYGLTPELAYPSVVSRLAAADGHPIEPVNAGVSGETSAGALRRMDWVLRSPADVIVIETGANDALRGLDPDSTRANLRRIIARVREAQPRAELVLVQMEAPPNYGIAYVRRFREMYRDVAREERVELAPFLLDGVAGLPELNQADGIHPNRRGAELVAANVWEALKPVVQRVETSARD